jgi:hypothetical protein
VLDNIFVTFGSRVYRQRLGIPMGFSSSPMMAVLMLAVYELQWLELWAGLALRARDDATLVSCPWYVQPVQWSQVAAHCRGSTVLPCYR